jgi:hypothetical protein
MVKEILEKFRDNVCEFLVDWRQSEVQKQMPYLFNMRMERRFLAI